MPYADKVGPSDAQFDLDLRCPYLASVDFDYAMAFYVLPCKTMESLNRFV